MIDRRTSALRRRPMTKLPVILALALPVSGAIALDIIFDPENFAQNVEQTVALLQQIERIVEQIHQQEQLLAHLPVSVADALTLAGQALDSQLNRGFASLNTEPAAVGGELATPYPIVFPKPTPSWLHTQRPAWTQAERGRLLHERDLAQQLHDQMAPTEDRLATIIAASNGVGVDPRRLPGEVAVAQAHVELLALCCGEADKLIAIRAARAQRRVQSRAQAQSESAYQTARRNQLLADWGAPSQSQAITDPFSFAQREGVSP